jgi:hypothetical protein
MSQSTTVSIARGEGDTSLTSPGVPSLAISLAQLSGGSAMPARPGTPHTLAVSATGAAIQADLASPHSVLVANAARISSLTASDGGTVTLTAAQLMAPGVNSVPVGALTNYRGILSVTGASVADLTFIAGLAMLPDAFALVDTAAHISFDLAAGGGSDILTLLGSISGITVSDGAALRLTASQMLSAGVDDGPGSALARITPSHLDVTSATVAQLALLASAQIRPESIHVRDTGPSIRAALATTQCTLLSDLARIANIFDRDGAIVALSGGHVRAESAASATVAELAALTALAELGRPASAGDETMSAAAIVRVSHAPDAGISFAGGDAGNAASSFGALASTALSRDALALAPAEFAQLPDDTRIDEGHIASAVLSNAGIKCLGQSAPPLVELAAPPARAPKS